MLVALPAVGAVGPGERLDVLADLADAARALPLRAHDVQRVEVEVRRVLAQVAVLVVQRDVAEDDGRLFVLVRLVVDASAPVLDLRQLVAVVDEADEPVERIEHAVLGLVQLARYVARGLVPLRLLRLAAPQPPATHALTGVVVADRATAHFALSALVLLLVEVVVAEHRRVGGVLGELALRVQLHDAVEGRTTGGPVLHAPEELREEVRDPVLGRPVAPVDVRELHLVHVREAIQHDAVERRGAAHRGHVVGARLIVGADRLAVPGRGELDEHRRGGLLALRDRLGRVAGAGEVLLDVDESTDLGHLLVLRSGRDDRVGDAALPVTEPWPLGPLRHEPVIDLDRLGPVTGVVVELGQALEHLERLIVVGRVSSEELERASGCAHPRVRQHQLPPRLPREVGRVTRVGVLLGELDRAHELRQRAAEVLEVVERPRLLVERVAVDRVPVGWDLGDLRVELLRRAHVSLAEVVLGERQVGVRNEAGLREALDQAVVDLTRPLELPHLLEAEGQREEDLVHVPVVRVVADEARVGADRLLPEVLELLLHLPLTLLQLADLRRVLRLARLEDRLIHRAGLGVVVLLQLELRLGEPEQVVGAARVAGAGAADETLEHGHLTLEEVERPGLDPIAVAAGGRVDLDRRAGHAAALRLLFAALRLPEVRRDLAVDAGRTRPRPFRWRGRVVGTALDVLPRVGPNTDAPRRRGDALGHGGRRGGGLALSLRAYRERDTAREEPGGDYQKCQSIATHAAHPLSPAVGALSLHDVPARSPWSAHLPHCEETCWR